MGSKGHEKHKKKKKKKDKKKERDKDRKHHHHHHKVLNNASLITLTEEVLTRVVLALTHKGT